MEEFVRHISESVNRLTSTSAFNSFADKLDPDGDDDVLVNNSFVFRQGVDTTKSPFHLVLKRDGGTIKPLPYVVELPTTFHKDFKLLSHHGKPDARYALPDAISDQLKRLGQLVFILVGRLDDSVVITQDVNHSACTQVTLDPTQEDLVRVTEEGQVWISNAYDEERIWNSVKERVSEVSNAQIDGLRPELGVALDKLQSEAYAHLRLPRSDEVEGRPVIAEVNDVLKGQHERYRRALARCEGNPDKDLEAYNEVLRIAYNFSSDAVSFLRLLVSVCDLKPIVLWGIVGARFELVESFRALPWVRSHKKPSLGNYQSTIGDARNSAFHDLFPFRKSLEVSLPSESLRGIRLRIFSEHSRKRENELRYQDKELVEVLTDFTRARRRFVPPEFWRKNAVVMEATINLFDRTAEYLELLADEAL